MKIGDLGTPSLPPALRHAAASPPVQAAAPVDGVELQGARPTDLSGAGGATAAAVAMTALAPRDLSRDEMKILVESLARNGVEFSSRRKYLWFYGDWSTAASDRVAKMADKGKEGRVVARAPGMGWVPVKDQGDLRELEVFRGGAAPENLPKPELARAVQELEKGGAVFRAVDDYYSYGNEGVFGAYGAYNVLSGDPHGWENVIVKTKSGEKAQLKTADEALALAFFENLAGTQGLERPRQAESLRLLQMAGLSLPDKPFMQYRFLGESKPDKVLPVTYGSAPLAEIRVADLEDPVAVAARLQSLKQDYDATRKAVGEDASSAWRLLQADGSKRPFADRLAAYAQIQGVVSKPEPLYKEVLASTPEGRDLNTREALEIARVFQRPNGETVTKAWNEMRRLAADGKSGVTMAELKLRFTLLLAQTQDPGMAVEALDVLSTSGPAASYADREAVLLQLRGLPKGRADLALAAVKALARHGGLPGDAALMADLLGNGAREEAPAAYEHVKTAVPPELHGSFARVFGSLSELSEAKAAFQTLAQGPPDRVPARVETWRGFLGVRSSWNQGKTATEALGLLQEGPDFDRQAALMKRALTFGSHNLPETWKKVLNAGESYIRLCEATRSTSRADEALALLDRPELAAGGRPFAERAEALALLTESRDGDLAKGTDTLRFLASWTPAERSLSETARHLSDLEKVAGAAEARLALAAAWTSPPGGAVGPTTHASLVEALKVGGTLAESRGLWTWLESGGSPDLLRLASSVIPPRSEGRPEAVRQFVEALAAVKPSAEEQAAIAKACEGLGRGADVQTFAREVVAGHGRCGPRVAAFGVLANTLRHASSALALWGAVRADVGRPDFPERCAALASLSQGRNAEQALDLYAKTLSAWRAGESLDQTATLLGRLGPDGLGAVRRWLDGGTVEGAADPENTRFLADLVKSKNVSIESLRSAWDLVARPVGRENTAERREAFMALHDGNVGATVAIWADLTSWLADGEGLVEVARSYRELGKALGRDDEAQRAVQFIRQQQRSGKLGEMTLPEAMQRLVQIAATAVTGRGRNLDGMLKDLLESATPSAAREIRQSEGGVRIGSIDLPGRG